MPALPAPGSPEEEELMRKALRAIERDRPFMPMTVRTNPAYEAVTPPKPNLSPHAEFFKRAINAAQLAHVAGEPVTYNSIVARDNQLADPKLYELLETPLFRSALEERGIAESDLDYLTERQIGALAVLSDHTVRKPERVKLRSIGVSWEMFQNWLLIPAFRREYRAMQSRILQIATERGDSVLAQLIDDGNMRAIEYANAMTGRYDPASRDATNALSILQLVMSLVQKHVTDEVALMRLSEDFERLAAQGGLRQLETLEAEVIEPPE